MAHLVAHQYDFMRLPDVDWSWLIQHRRTYAEGPRGDMITKFNINWVPHYESGTQDVAILHLDQQCLEENLWDRGKGSVYRNMNETITDIPKILIMHGTPYYPELFPSDIKEDNYKDLGYTEDQIGMSSILIEKLKEVLGDNYVVFNSHKARRQWGFENNDKAETIIHGMYPDEWFDLPKEPRVVTMISPGGLDKYYDRFFLKGIKEALQERDIEHCHITVDAQFRNWDEYREFLGRSLLYINPTKESCMPRARTEAMLSGCCVLTTPHQDADTFIQDGVNGFLIPRNPEKVADLVVELMADYDRAIKIGQAGKAMAKGIFGYKRYQTDWAELIKKVLTK